ncbi:MAG: DUF29 domain-containing protein [Microcystaceae cyanobacterium]
MLTLKTLYETDYALWLEETAKHLRYGNLASLDIENLLEEIEAMGRSERRAIRRNLEQLLMHLLKWHYQPEKLTNSWKYSIREHRKRVIEDLEESPSLKPYFSEIVPKCYQNARNMASDQTGLNLSIFPQTCPFTPTEILDIHKQSK